MGKVSPFDSTKLDHWIHRAFGKNYFEIFHITQEYDVDQKNLLKSYLDLQREFHPDRYIASSEAEKRINMQWVAEINLAFETLSDDL